jgi:hypothetical protein
MLCPEVRVLYNYFRADPMNIEAIRGGRYWFAKPTSFNDPFDCSVNIAEDSLEESIQHALADVTSQPGFVPGSISLDPGLRDTDRKAFDEFRSRLTDYFGAIGFFCMSEVPDDLLMWSHYADSHKGFCIGFERRETNPLGSQAAPVSYRPGYPRLSARDFDPKVNPDSIDQVWLTKSDRWSYEREWRLLSGSGNCARPLGASICSVIFGARMSDEDRRTIRTATAEAHAAKYYQARKSANEFGLILDLVAG